MPFHIQMGWMVCDWMEREREGGRDREREGGRDWYGMEGASEGRKDGCVWD